MKIKKNYLHSFLDLVERVSNKLPSPVFLFFLLAIIVIIASETFYLLGASATHPVNGDLIQVRSLFSLSGFREILTTLVQNFINFPPLGVVLTTMIGIGVAEKSGFFEVLLRLILKKVANKYVVFMIAFISVNSSIIADAGLIILPPLSAIIFKNMGKNPIAGALLSFSAICGGFSANLSITALDPFLSELTNSAASLIDENYYVNPTANYYFMLVSVFLITFLSVVVNNRIVEKRVPYTDQTDIEVIDDYKISDLQKSGLKWAISTFSIILLLIVYLIIIESPLFINDQGEYIYLFKSVVSLLWILFFATGLVYAFRVKIVRNTVDISELMVDSMKTMASYIIMAFAAGQFLYYFNWSGLDLIIAINSADYLKDLELNGNTLIFSFLLFCMLLNLFISSASAKWAIFAPVFVPMMMLLEISPEGTQLIYRIGDSTTNMITPLLPYFPLLIVFIQEYKKEIKLGEIISGLLPYSIVYFIGWALMLIFWLIFNLPIGPGVFVFI